MKPTEDSIRRLIVEGESDRQVVLRLLLEGDFGFRTDEILVEPAHGYVNMVKTIRDRLSEPQFYSNQARAAVGIVVDADNDINTIWNQITAELLRAGVDVSGHSRPTPDGSVFMRPKPHLKVGVWVMPDNKGSGELEDFLVSMVPCNDTDWHLARKYVNNSEHKFGKKDTRAEVLSWIATRMYPGRFDEAIKNGDLCTDGELCQRFIAWLNRLFAIEDSAEDVGQRP